MSTFLDSAKKTARSAVQTSKSQPVGGDTNTTAALVSTGYLKGVQNDPKRGNMG